MCLYIHSYIAVLYNYDFLYDHIIAIFDAPKIIGISSSANCVGDDNTSVSLKCSLTAVTMEGVTIVVWLKDDLKIQNQDHYEIKSGPVHGKVNEIESTLTINSFTIEDQGTYTCYCYYNSSLIVSKPDIPITSNKKSITQRTDCGKRKGQNYSHCYIATAWKVYFCLTIY